MIEAVRFLGVLLLCGALSACYNPSYGDCQVSCASGACPAGLECQSGVCRAPGMTGPCTNADGGIDAGGVPIEELMEATFDSLCDYLVRCGQFEDKPLCLAVYGNIGRVQADVIAAVSAGSVIYHGDKAKQCIDSRATAGCERWKLSSNRATDPSCSEVFEGTRHDGETCAISEQCISLQCNLENCNNACCPGTCVGDEPPGQRDLGDACSQTDRCQDGYCDPFTKVCTAYRAPNDACMYSDQCMEGYGCLSSAAFPMGRCAALVATGGSCAESQECVMLGDVCTNGTCQAGGLAGAPCMTQMDCQTLHGCTNNQCTKPPGLNQSCMNVGVCLAGYCSYADPANPICTPKQPDLGTCSPNMSGLDCMSGYCNEGKCGQKPVCN